jgi:hypothetical protein
MRDEVAISAAIGILLAPSAKTWGKWPFLAPARPESANPRIGILWTLSASERSPVAYRQSAALSDPPYN